MSPVRMPAFLVCALCGLTELYRTEKKNSLLMLRELIVSVCRILKDCLLSVVSVEKSKILFSLTKNHKLATFSVLSLEIIG